MTRFKPGDKVRCLSTSRRRDYIKGNIYIVKGVTNYTLFTELDNHGSKTNGWDISYFEHFHIKEFSDKLNKLID